MPNVPIRFTRNSGILSVAGQARIPACPAVLPGLAGLGGAVAAGRTRPHVTDVVLTQAPAPLPGLTRAGVGAGGLRRLDA